jgi:hypothetical protein
MTKTFTPGEILTASDVNDFLVNKIVQVVANTTTTPVVNTTSTYADTTLTATITPTSATSKVLVLVNQNGVAKRTNNTQFQIRLLRDSTVVSEFELQGGDTQSIATNFVGSSSASILDTPGTTSAVTYKTQFRSRNNLAQVDCQGLNSESSIVLLEVSA